MGKLEAKATVLEKGWNSFIMDTSELSPGLKRKRSKDLLLKLGEVKGLMASKGWRARATRALSRASQRPAAASLARARLAPGRGATSGAGGFKRQTITSMASKIG